MPFTPNVVKIKMEMTTKYWIRPKEDSYLTGDFMYQLLLLPQIREQVVGFANGTTVNMLKVEGLQKPGFA
jgi:type I restriction enzyme S subunit